MCSFKLISISILKLLSDCRTERLSRPKSLTLLCGREQVFSISVGNIFLICATEGPSLRAAAQALGQKHHSHFVLVLCSIYLFSSKNVNMFSLILKFPLRPLSDKSSVLLSFPSICLLLSGHINEGGEKMHLMRTKHFFIPLQWCPKRSRVFRCALQYFSALKKHQLEDVLLEACAECYTGVSEHRNKRCTVVILALGLHNAEGVVGMAHMTLSRLLFGSLILVMQLMMSAGNFSEHISNCWL